ncbi:hypothetical protein [Listeria booriae]|nr:hypothetical protein [Listeria booriae]
MEPKVLQVDLVMDGELVNLFEERDLKKIKMLTLMGELYLIL